MAVDTEIVSYHVHTDESPFCKSWSSEDGQAKATAWAGENGGLVVGPYSYTSVMCPYKNQRKEALAQREDADDEPRIELPDPPDDAPEETSEQAADAVIEEIEDDEPEPIPAPLSATGTAVAADPASPPPTTTDETVCTVCGEPLDEHTHPTMAGGGRASRLGTTRKKPEEHPPCPHCGGRIHWNDSGGKVNFECLFRQRLVEQGTITNPLTDRLPIATASDLADLGLWITAKQAAGTPLRYGKMEDAGGGAPTYAALRSPSKPKPEPTPPIASIEAVAGSLVTELPDPTPESGDAQEPELTKAERKKARQEKLKAMRK
jgi:hypothetical protein